MSLIIGACVVNLIVGDVAVLVDASLFGVIVGGVGGKGGRGGCLLWDRVNCFLRKARSLALRFDSCWVVGGGLEVVGGGVGGRGG